MIDPLFIGPRKIISRIAENSGGSRFLKKKNMKYRSKKKEFIIKAEEHKTVFRITRNNVNNRIIGSKSYVVRVPFEH